MIPSILTIKNFLSYGEEPVIISFDSFSLVCLSGNNGHGKSALLDALTWSLWGFARRPLGTNKSDETLIRIGSSDLEVSLSFYVNDQYYKVIRKAVVQNKKCSASLFFGLCNDNQEITNSLNGSSIRETQLIINDIIGFDYDTFINSAYFKQGQSNEFSKKTAQERKEILCKFLKLDQLELVRQKVLEDIKLIQQEIFSSSIRSDDLEKKYNQSFLELNKKEDFLFKKGVYLKLKEELKIEKEHYKLDILNREELKKSQKNQAELEEKLVELVELQKKYKETIERKNIFKKRIENIAYLLLRNSRLSKIIDNKSNSLHLELHYIELELRIFSDRIHSFNKKDCSICSLCENYISKNRIEELIKKSKKEEDLFLFKKNKILRSIDKVFNVKKKIENYSKLLLYEEIKNISSLEKINSIEFEVISIKEKIDTLNIIKKNNLDKINTLLLSIDKQKFLPNIENRESELIEKYEELATIHAVLKQAENFILQIKEEIEVIKKKKEEDQKKLFDLQQLAYILSKDALQASIIESLLPILEEEANQLLSKLTNQEYRIIIESTRDLKNGKAKETLDILIEDSLGRRPYEFFSGGEAFKIDISLRLALIKLITIHTKKKLELLIIDEGFGSQDGMGLDCLIDMLHVLQDEFKKIIVVSHLDSMKDHFPVHFLVHKTGKGSNVSVMWN